MEALADANDRCSADTRVRRPTWKLTVARCLNLFFTLPVSFYLPYEHVGSGASASCICGAIKPTDGLLAASQRPLIFIQLSSLLKHNFWGSSQRRGGDKRSATSAYTPWEWLQRGSHL